MPPAINKTALSTQDVFDWIKEHPGASGAIGGALGGTAMSLGRDEDESNKDHALRVIRNALIGGALGGAGATALASGLPAIGESVGAIDPPPAEGGGNGGNGGGGNASDRGIWSTPAGRSATAAGVYGAQHMRGARIASKNVEEALSTLLPKGIKNMAIPDGGGGWIAANHELVGRTPRDFMNLRNYLQAQVDTHGINNVVAALQGKELGEKLPRGVKKFVTNTGLGGKQIEALLAQAGIHGKSPSLGRKILTRGLNPWGHGSKGLAGKSIRGGAGGLATIGALFLPDAAGAISGRVSSGLGEVAKQQALRAVPGDTPPADKGFLNWLFTPISLSQARTP